MRRLHILVMQDPIPLSVSRPRMVNNMVSPELDAIVAKATALKVTERYEFATELKKDLEALKLS